MLARGYVTRRNQPSTRPTLTLAAGLVRSHTITGMRRPIVLSNTVTFTFVRKEIITSGRFAFIRRRKTRNLRNPERSEEHTSELQSLMRISYGVFCLKKNNK